MSKTIAAAASRNGTITSKVWRGVTSSSVIPTAPPNPASNAHRRSQRPCPRSSGREPKADPGKDATRATAIVTLAGSGAMPTAKSAGYAISDVIPPAAPMAPAITPAPMSRMTSKVEITRRLILPSTSADVPPKPCSFRLSGASQQNLVRIKYHSAKDMQGAIPIVAESSETLSLLLLGDCPCRRPDVNPHANGNNLNPKMARRLWAAKSEHASI